EDAVRAVVSAILRRRGYEVLEAPRPSVACEIFDRRGPEIDLLLTDVVMPEMNGGALAERLIARRPELRVLFISGYTDSTTQPSIGNPNTSFLSKPFHAAALDAGYETTAASDGPEAIEAAAKMEHFDLLVTDVMMPQMTGDELARRLRIQHPSLKVLYLTGFSDRLFKEKVTLWADEAFLDKPC